MSNLRAAFCTIVAVATIMAWHLPGNADDYHQGVTATVLKKTTLTGNGQKISYPATDKAEVTAMMVDIAPGAETGWHSHPIPVYAYVLSGTLDIEMEGGEKKVFGQGDVIIEVLNARHNGRNNGSGKVSLVVFYTGVEGVPNVVKPDQKLPAR